MKNSVTATFFIGMLVSGYLGAFWFTRSQAIADWRQDNPTWLTNVSDEIIQTEEEFCQWMNQNKQLLRSRRLDLAQLLEDPESTDALILEKANQIGETHEELLRGVCQHLNSMRSVLPEDQKDLLRGFCMQSMQGQGAMYRRGRAFQEQLGQQQNPARLGFGNGFRRGQRNGCCGLTRKLQMTEEQLAIAQEKDPTFEEDVRELQNQLFAERQGLLLLLVAGQNPNGQLADQFDRLINAYNALENRLITYVLVMRPYFTTEQQKQLVGMCKNDCSDDANCEQLE